MDSKRNRERNKRSKPVTFAVDGETVWSHLMIEIKNWNNSMKPSVRFTHPRPNAKPSMWWNAVRMNFNISWQRFTISFFILKITSIAAIRSPVAWHCTEMHFFTSEFLSGPTLYYSNEFTFWLRKTRTDFLVDRQHAQGKKSCDASREHAKSQNRKKSKSVRCFWRNGVHIVALLWRNCAFAV